MMKYKGEQKAGGQLLIYERSSFPIACVGNKGRVFYWLIRRTGVDNGIFDPTQQQRYVTRDIATGCAFTPDKKALPCDPNISSTYENFSDYEYYRKSAYFEAHFAEMKLC